MERKDDVEHFDFSRTWPLGASLDQIYQAVHSLTEKTEENPNWKAKVRQVLNQNEFLFKSVDRGVWALA